MSIRIFKSVLIRQQLSQQELDDLAADFLSYKKDGVLPDTFGRDALYDDNHFRIQQNDFQSNHLSLHLKFYQYNQLIIFSIFLITPLNYSESIFLTF